MDEFIEIKNFFDKPENIREVALLSNYNKCNFFQEKEVWSGYRSIIPFKWITNDINEKIKNVLEKDIEYLTVCFHMNPEISCFGAPHIDSRDSKAFAGVIYLNEYLPDDLDYGTTLYENPPESVDLHSIQIMYNVDIPIHNKHKLKIREDYLNYKNSLTIKQNIKNEYNKIVLYRSNIKHAADYYFGDKLENSRLTIAIHGKFE